MIIVSFGFQIFRLIARNRGSNLECRFTDRDENQVIVETLDDTISHKKRLLFVSLCTYKYSVLWELGWALLRIFRQIWTVFNGICPKAMNNISCLNDFKNCIVVLAGKISNFI